MAFVLVSQTGGLRDVANDATTSQLLPAATADPERWQPSHRIALFVTGAVHLALLTLWLLRPADAARTKYPGEGHAMTLIASKAADEVTPPSVRAPQVSATIVPPVAPQSAPVVPQTSEWQTITVRQAVAPPAQAAPDKMLFALAARQSSAGGGGSYDTYAGAAPVRRGETASQTLPVKLIAVLDRLVPDPDAAALDAVRLAAVALGGRGTVTLVVRVDATGIVVTARAVPPSDPWLAAMMVKLVVGHRLFAAAGKRFEARLVVVVPG